MGKEGMTKDLTLLEMAIARFRELHQQHGHLPRSSRHRTPDMLRQFHAAQCEMFHLAQVISMLVDPKTQLELDNVRREIMEQIELNIKVPTGARVETKQLGTGQLIWSEFQLTPEIAVDPTITGNAVLWPLLRRLKALLRTQRGLVNTRVYGKD
jgi:hypothetical protein